MATKSESRQSPIENPTTTQRKGERELVVTRTINGPVHLVWEAWTKPELFKRWWVPKSIPMVLLSCDQDVRVGGKYKLVFSANDSTMEFFGTYTEVEPHTRLAWTNEEGGQEQVTTVTFEQRGDTTLLTVHNLFASKQALDDEIASGATAALPEQFDQLEQLLTVLAKT
jgi:uncharacterized protein YndB with AHSA1/START domain